MSILQSCLTMNDVAFWPCLSYGHVQRKKFFKCRLTAAALSPAHPRSHTNYPVPYASARLHTPATCPRQACAEEGDARATRHQRVFACMLLAVAEHTMLHTTAARCDTVFGRDIIRSHNHHIDHLRRALDHTDRTGHTDHTQNSLPHSKRIASV